MHTAYLLLLHFPVPSWISVIPKNLGKFLTFPFAWATGLRVSRNITAQVPPTRGLCLWPDDSCTVLHPATLGGTWAGDGASQCRLRSWDILSPQLRPSEQSVLP